MFRGALFVRYSTYFFGIFITALNIFLLTYFLDVNEFSVWGISMSLIYVLSQLGQLTYVQYVDKYFPNISYQEMKNKLYRFIKTIFLFSPIWFLILEFLKIIGYFQKFKIENIENLFLMVVALIILESSIEVVSKFMLASKNTKNYDISELFILKILRVVSFYLLLINNYSIFHLLFVSVLIRGSFLIYILFLVEKSIIKIIKNIFFANIFFDNFQNFKYTLYAFLIKTFQISFLNLIFLIYTRNSVSETIAAFSLGVIIVNNVRPIISSLSSLMTPSLSEKAKKKEIASEYLVKSSFLNTLIASFFIVGILIFVEFKGLYEMYFLEFDNYVYTIAIVSVFASTINPIYTPAFIFIKFSEKEVNIFKFVTTNFILSLFTFLYLQTIGISRVILIYIMFELLNLFGTNYLYKKNFENTSIFKLSKNFLLLVGFSFVDLFFTDLPLNRFIILSLIVLIFDFYSIYKLKDSYKLFFKNLK